MATTNRILFLSHGGGPLPLLGDQGHAEMVDFLKSIAGRISRPSAILVVSAHWEEATPTVTAGAHPPLIYDYYGFPEESYAIHYPCPGEPHLAGRICTALVDAGITARMDEQRGFDHGLFVPLKIMYPDAGIPCVQLSLVRTLDPAFHLQIGQALRGLDNTGLLIIGSGFSFHNMKAFFTEDTRETKMMNEAFDAWLWQTCKATDISEEERRQKLMRWQEAPYARYCHPREEHLLPLHVCYGLAGARCSESFSLQILNKRSSNYLW